MYAVFEVTVLRLKMMRTEMHALGPNNSSQVLHCFINLGPGIIANL